MKLKINKNKKDRNKHLTLIIFAKHNLNRNDFGNCTNPKNKDAAKSITLTK
jgi:hypothetical protein